MLGAIIGDIVGSVYEFNNIKTKDFPLFQSRCFPTDDSIMTLAVANAIMESREADENLEKCAVRNMQELGRLYPDGGYGGSFRWWLISRDPKPYGSYGNGAAMRVSPCAYAAKTLDEAKMLSEAVTAVTHNHPEGLKGAEATTVAIWLAKMGCNKNAIREKIHAEYYPMDFTLDSIRDRYQFNETCQGTVPQAVMAFLESTGFEDAIRNAVSLGGDSDTLAAITGSIAQAYYGVPEDIRETALGFLDDYTKEILEKFETAYMR